MPLNGLALGAEYSEQFLAWISLLFGQYGITAVSILKIIGINIVLSGDNAVVIALACRALPKRQRTIGIVLGAGAAIVLRIIFTFVMQQLLDIPFLKLAGGLLLLWIAVKLLISEEASEESVSSGSNLWEAVRIIAIADVVMSLDNVLAIAVAAQGNQTLVIIGLLISVPLVVFGSTLIIGLLHRFPVLVWAGAALLGWIAGELLTEEPALREAFAEITQVLAMPMPAIVKMCQFAGAVLVVAVGAAIKKYAARDDTYT